ncbi:arylesterase [Thalassotalea euphylliae]|uniref:arylesterase n=1 Tax=Thalassotalea euphylliae TaxID=1655234 RepID=UPI0036419E10
MFKCTSKLMLTALLLAFCFNANAVSRILLLGDSLSASYGMKQNQGWVYLLNQQLKTNNAGYEIINASISGETTAGGLSRLPGILSKEKFDYLLIELGGNDGLRGFPADLIKNNLLQIIGLAKAEGIKVHLMAIRIPPNYGPRYNKLFEQVFVDVSQQAQVPLMPFFLNTVAIDTNNMQSDGIHPNVKAQPLIVDIMAEATANMIKGS